MADDTAPGVAAGPVPIVNVSQNVPIQPPASIDLSDANAKDNWKLWLQLWNNYAIVAGLQDKEEKYRVALFLSSLGVEGIKIFNGFTFDETKRESKESLECIISKFDDYIIGTVNETYERFKFNSRNQNPGEKFESYLTVLQDLAKTCGFCDCLRDTLLRDRIVLGIQDNNTRKKLLQERALTLDKTIDVCKSAELVSTQVKDIADATSNSKSADVNKVTGAKHRHGGHKKSKPTKSSTSGATSDKVKVKQIHCKFCGLTHDNDRNKCPAWGKTCSKCHGANHFAKKCRSRSRKVHGVQDESDSESEEEIELIGNIRCINEVHDSESSEIYAEMRIDKKPVRFQLDSGAAVNILPRKYAGDVQMQKTNKVLQMWNNSRIVPLGKCRKHVRNPENKKLYSVEFIIVKEDLAPLLGLQAVQQMKLITVNSENFKRVAAVKEKRENYLKDPIIAKHAAVFDNSKIGKFEGKVHLEVDPTVKPVVRPSRRSPVALRGRFKNKLDDLQSHELITTVDQPTDWVNQYVIAEKSSGELRICIDPGPLNCALRRSYHYLPVIDDILPELSKAKVFSKLDLANAYWHCELDEESSFLTTFQTEFGRYRWRRLPFGLSVSSEIFGKRLAHALNGLKGVLHIADDVFAYGVGETYEEACLDHDKNLDALLERAEKSGLIFNLDKLELREPQIDFTGHVLTQDGLKADPKKIEAVKNLPSPKDKAEIQRFIALPTFATIGSAQARP